MVRNTWLFKAAFGACFSSLILFSGKASAQMSISPLVIEAQADRGQAQGMIAITNTSNTLFRVRVYAEPFTYSRDAGFQTLPANSPNNLTPYLQFSPRELTIKPGESRRVRLIGRLAPNLAEGEYRAVVFNETLNESKDSAGNNVTLATRIGVTFYVRKGNIAPKLAVDRGSFNARQKQIQLLVRNTGKATVRPSINWILRRGGSVVKTGKVDATAVVAESDRNLLFNYPGKENLAPGQYQLSGELVWSENDKKSKLPFNMNVTIPASTTTSEKK
jgi:P pilus assembly chaperone PapD